MRGRAEQAERSGALRAFKAARESGRGAVVVASDAMTRGMDIKEVHNVVNYDAPVYAKTYVHRVGRTARAGAAGRAFTLLRHEEVRPASLLNSCCKCSARRLLRLASEEISLTLRRRIRLEDYESL